MTNPLARSFAPSQSYASVIIDMPPQQVNSSPIAPSANDSLYADVEDQFGICQWICEPLAGLWHMIVTCFFGSDDDVPIEERSHTSSLDRLNELLMQIESMGRDDMNVLTRIYRMLTLYRDDTLSTTVWERAISRSLAYVSVPIRQRLSQYLEQSFENSEAEQAPISDDFCYYYLGQCALQDESTRHRIATFLVKFIQDPTLHTPSPMSSYTLEPEGDDTGDSFNQSELDSMIGTFLGQKNEPTLIDSEEKRAQIEQMAAHVVAIAKVLEGIGHQAAEDEPLDKSEAKGGGQQSELKESVVSDASVVEPQPPPSMPKRKFNIDNVREMTLSHFKNSRVSDSLFLFAEKLFSPEVVGVHNQKDAIKHLVESKIISPENVTELGEFYLIPEDLETPGDPDKDSDEPLDAPGAVEVIVSLFQSIFRIQEDYFS